MNIEHLVAKIQLANLTAVCQELKINLRDEVLLRRLTMQFNQDCVKIIKSKTPEVQDIYQKMLEAQVLLIDEPQFKELTIEIGALFSSFLGKLVNTINEQQQRGCSGD